jgi:Ca2+-binding EF-hand superfamily protein
MNTARTPRVAFLLPRRKRPCSGFGPALAFFCALGLAVPATRAAEDAPVHDPEVAFSESDENRDGRIDRPEFVARLVEIFFHGDRDKDGLLTFSEMQQVVAFPEDFRNADASGDGKISMPEFLKARAGTFDQADADADGLLSLEEVIAAYERKAKAR